MSLVILRTVQDTNDQHLVLQNSIEDVVRLVPQHPNAVEILAQRRHLRHLNDAVEAGTQAI